MRAVGAQLQPHDAVHIFPARRQHQDRDHTGAADLPQHVKAVEAREHHVQDDQIEWSGPRPIQPLRAVMLHLDVESFALEQLLQQSAQLHVVVDQKDPHAQQIA